jgi:hypothetical protein
MVSGDFNHDGVSDIAAMYDYGNGKMGIWSFESTTINLVPRVIYMGANGNWDVSATKFVVAGDINKDGYDDIAAMYDYGKGKIGIWSFEANGTILTPRVTYMGATGNWNLSATKFVTSGDFNNDGLTDISALYDYNNGAVGIWSFE